MIIFFILRKSVSSERKIEQWASKEASKYIIMIEEVLYDLTSSWFFESCGFVFEALEDFGSVAFWFLENFEVTVFVTTVPSCMLAVYNSFVLGCRL